MPHEQMTWFARRKQPPLDTPPASNPVRTPPQSPATESDIADAYRLILRREPDADGWRQYAERLRDGLSLNDLISSLLSSDEYRDRCAQRPSAPADAPSPSPLGGEGRSADPSVDRPAASPSIDPRDVIRRYTVEELAETSDEYFRRVDDPTPLMSKPFTFLHETPEMLQNLGLLLSGLHLGKTMTVLDFGAGTCWLSRYLVQLHCYPICCDVSPAALAIGRRLFEAYPIIGPAVSVPVFLPFDGHRLELEDESVDRVVCFDAFHHVPNPAEVIAEFGRVLRPGGIAGFSEPGRRHSQSAQSQYEMRNHRVLENDIDVTAIFAMGRQAGFTDLAVKVLIDRAVGPDEYREVQSGRPTPATKDAVWRAASDTMVNRSIFFLHKGPVGLDSRGHEGLAHLIATEQTDCRVAPGEPATLAFRLTNTGRATWLHRNREIFGIVRLASHLYDSSNRIVEVDHSRHDLPSDVRPGETIAMSVTVPLPALGDCWLSFDLVAEGVTWFENIGSQPIVVRIRR
jgi:SAM-dependent methyltransferase